MHFIIFDLELNQDFSTLQNFDSQTCHYPFEIIQIGAIKLDSDLNTTGTFNRYIRPTFYARISPFITELTGITTDQLHNEQSFADVYQSYVDFIGGTDGIFCTWGMADVKWLYKNALYHQLNQALLPRQVINLQPYLSLYFNHARKNLLRLQSAVELLDIPITQPFHNAFNDAFYTAEVFKKIYSPYLQPAIYDPFEVPVKRLPVKRILDTEKLIKQFEKMYAREMSEEEQGMIVLAYKMGRTSQFLK